MFTLRVYSNLMVLIDGERYERREDAPDLGSWVAQEGNGVSCHRNYFGKAADVAKLPKYDSLASGCMAMCVDTGDVYIYHSGDKVWYKQ